MLKEFAQLYEGRFKKKFPWREWRIKYVACCLAANMTHNCVHSCLTHVINLGTQVLISTYRKAPHYEPHNPHAHEPDTTMHREHDEIGLIRSICVKVIGFSLRTMIYWFFQRSDLPRSARNYTKWSKSRLASPALHNSFWTWRFVGCRPTWWLIVQKLIKRWVKLPHARSCSHLFWLISHCPTTAHWRLRVRDGATRARLDEAGEDWLP